MEAERRKYPLVVITGPTASGKTALAIKVAKNYNGEVISADSRAIYRGLTIGTAKPSLEEQSGIPHWGIDLVNPDERFTVSDFQAYANSKIDDIRDRKKLPILVGGTGLYVDAVVYGYEFPVIQNESRERDKLQSLSLQELYDYCGENNISLPENDKNKRYVVNAILRNGGKPKRKNELDDNTFVVGITTKKEILRERIIARAKSILDEGVVDEAISSASLYGWNSVAMTGNIYPLIHEYVQEKISKSELETTFATKDWQLAKRQLTWLRRNEHIYWTKLEDAYTYIAHRLDEVNHL